MSSSKLHFFVQIPQRPMRRKKKLQHSHAPTPAARGELHFNELLILVCAPVIITTDLMNIYAPCLKFMHMRNRRRFTQKQLISGRVASISASPTPTWSLKRIRRDARRKKIEMISLSCVFFLKSSV